MLKALLDGVLCLGGAKFLAVEDEGDAAEGTEFVNCSLCIIFGTQVAGLVAKCIGNAFPAPNIGVSTGFDTVRTLGALEVPGFKEPCGTKLGFRPLVVLAEMGFDALVACRLVEPGAATLLAEVSVAFDILQPDTDAVAVGSPEIMKPLTGYEGHDSSAILSIVLIHLRGGFAFYTYSQDIQNCRSN